MTGFRLFLSNMTAEAELPEVDPAQPRKTVVSDSSQQREPMPPLESRFLYVDVAARRAKQLRRGALPRLKGLIPNTETGEQRSAARKLERIAMEEVDKGLVVYELPDPKVPSKDVNES